MPFFIHLAVIAAYMALAGAVALMLPRSLAGVEPMTGYVIGICVFLAAGLVHEIMARRYEARDIANEVAEVWHVQADEVDGLRQANDRLLRDLATARAELSQLRERVETAATERSDKLVAEIRVLQQQLRQFALRTGKAAEAVDLAPPPEPAAQPPATELPSARAAADDVMLDVIRQALEENRVDLYLQPVVSLPQRKTRFYEAFSRIRTREGEILLPERYLSLASERGLLPVIDNLLLFRCVQLVRRVRRRNLDVGFFINISAASLADREFFGEFVAFMESNPELAERLIFEMSQHDLSRNRDALAADLRRLGELGFRFSLDQVTHLDVDIERLVRQHVRFIKISPGVLLSDAAAATARIHPIDLKQALKRSNIDLVVDKVETEEQMLELLAFGVDFGQGYLFGEPRLSRNED